MTVNHDSHYVNFSLHRAADGRLICDRPCRLPTADGLINVGGHRPCRPPAASGAEARRILPMNQIDDEARPLNDTSDHLTSAEETMGVQG